MPYLKSFRLVAPPTLTKHSKHGSLLESTLTRRNIGDNERWGRENFAENLSRSLTPGVREHFGEKNFSFDRHVLSPAARSSSQLAMRTLPVTDAESFFFRDKDHSICKKDAYYANSLQIRTISQSSSKSFPFCLLCREYLEPPCNKRLHIASANRSSHTNHTCREVSLDSLALLAMHGYSIDHMYEVWSDALYHHETFFRIPSLVSPVWPIEKRADILSKILLFLKDMHVLDLCLAGVTPEQSTCSEATYHNRRRAAFERLEYIGDNAWGTHISSRMMILYPDQQWQYSERPFTFNCFRDACEMNAMLDLMFDVLHLKRLHPSYGGARIGSGKVKADILEALIGELHINAWGLEPQIYDESSFVEVNDLQASRLLALIKHCLTEIYDLIVLWYSQNLSWNAQSLAKELAVRHTWKHMMPRIQRYKTHMRHTTPHTVVECVDLSSGCSVTTQHDSDVDSQRLSSVTQIQSLQKLNLRPVANIYLPPLPKLLNFSRPCPDDFVHPLLKMTFEKLPESMLIEHTKQDAFAYLHQSFKRLDLLSNKSFQVFNYVEHCDQTRMLPKPSGPQWENYILQLVPHVLTRKVFESSSCTRKEILVTYIGEALSFSLNKVIEQEDVSDNGSEDLIDFAHTSDSLTDSVFLEDTSNAHFEDSCCNHFHFPISFSNSDVFRLCQSPRQHDSLQLSLRTHSKSRHESGIVDSTYAKGITQKTLKIALSNVYPQLIPVPLHEDVGKANNTINEHDLKVNNIFLRLSRAPWSDSQYKSIPDLCLFFKSRYVPDDVKPPNAGVITDQNLHNGQYAFLAYRRSNSFMAYSLLGGAQFHTMREDIPQTSLSKRFPRLNFTEADVNTTTNYTMKNVLEWKYNDGLIQEKGIEQISGEGCVEENHRNDKNLGK